MSSRSALSISLVLAGSMALAGYGSSPHMPVAPQPMTPDRALGGLGVKRADRSRDSLVGVFEGRTPCGAVAVEFTEFRSPACEKIKWRLTLYRDARAGTPSTFVYQGTRTSRQGRWRIERPAGPEGRTLYGLSFGTPEHTLWLLSIEDKVLLLLDHDRRVLVGDASWSYVLNRVDPSPPQQTEIR